MGRNNITDKLYLPWQAHLGPHDGWVLLSAQWLVQTSTPSVSANDVVCHLV